MNGYEETYGPSIDLEAPYQDDLRRAAEADEREEEIHRELWSDLRDLDEAEKMVRDHDLDLLPRIIQIVATAEKGKQAEAFKAIRKLIDDEVWKVAEWKVANE